MKLIYLQPEIEVFSSNSEGSLMAATIDSTRNIDGGVTEGSGGLPSTVGDYDGTGDSPYEDSEGNGKGQGNNGGGSRAKSGMIWDEW